jgi:hypothetical protein
MTLASIFWAFRVSEDPSSPIDPDANSDTANTHPLPFKLKFEPRGNALEKLFVDDVDDF